MESILITLSELGMPLASLSRYWIFMPVFLFVITIVLYVVSTRQRKLRIHLDVIARGILSGARRRSQGLTMAEIEARLRNGEEEESSTTKSLISISEFLLKLVNFNKQETQFKLLQAGNRDPRALTRYIIRRGIGMMIAPVILWLLMGYLGFSGAIQIAVALTGILVGGIIVDVQLDKAVAARRARIYVELPVLLDLLTIYLDAGQGFDVSLARASVSLKTSFPTAAAEIYHLRQDLEVTIDRRRTLREFGARMGTQVARTFMSIVIQSEARGNDVGPALRSLAKEARKEVNATIEAKAQKIPTLMQLPMFVFILPAILASVLAPVVLQVIDMLRTGVI